MGFVPVTGTATFRPAVPPRDSVVEFVDDRRTVALPVRAAIPVLTKAHAREDLDPSVALLSGAALLGMRLVFMARVQQEISGVRVVLWQMIVSLPLFAFAGAAFETIRWENLAFAPIAGLLYQGVVIAGLGFMVISYLLSRYTPSVITSFNFVSPISGVLLSALLLGDEITSAILWGVVFVGAGLYFVSRPKAI